MEQNIDISEVKCICAKRPAERTNQEIQFLANFTSSVKVFKSLIESNGPYSHLICCKFLQYQSCEKGHYLFKSGDHGTRFYIIVSGKVGVEVFMKGQKGDKHTVEIMVLNNGASFGELALENSKPRAASIKCKVSSHFIYLEKADYDRIMSKIVVEKRESLVIFLQSLPIFQNYTKGRLTKLSYIFKEKFFNKKYTIYAEGDIADEIFIIKEGQVGFYKILKNTTEQKKSQDSLPKKKSYKLKNIANLGIGEMFGEEEVFQNIERKTTAKCLSDVLVVLSISKTVKFKQEFFKQINGEETLNYITNRIKNKAEQVDKRLNI